MLVACRLAGLSALETHYAGVRAGAQFGAERGCVTGPDLFCATKTAETRRDVGASGPEDPGLKF